MPPKRTAKRTTKAVYGPPFVEFIKTKPVLVFSSGSEYDEYCDGQGRHWVKVRGETRVRRHVSCWCKKEPAKTETT